MELRLPLFDCSGWLLSWVSALLLEVGACGLVVLVEVAPAVLCLSPKLQVKPLHQNDGWGGAAWVGGPAFNPSKTEMDGWISRCIDR